MRKFNGFKLHFQDTKLNKLRHKGLVRYINIHSDQNRVFINY
jgi:hypothetical protein